MLVVVIDLKSLLYRSATFAGECPYKGVKFINSGHCALQSYREMKNPV